MIPTILHLTGCFDEWKDLHLGWQFPKAEHVLTAECAKVQTDKFVQRRIRAIEALYQHGGVVVAHDARPKVDISELLRSQNQMNMEALWLAYDGRRSLSAFMAAQPGNLIVRRILDRLMDIRASLTMAKLDELVDIEARKGSGTVAWMQTQAVYSTDGGLIVQVKPKQTPTRPAATAPYPCIRRGAPMETVKCPSCPGRSVQIKTFECIACERCHISERSVPGVTGCKGCRKRVEPTQKVEVIPFADMMNRWPGGTGWIIGRGPTEFNFADLSKIPENEPVFFINDSVQLEHLVPHRNTFYLSLDVPVANSLHHRVTSIFVSGVLWNDFQHDRAYRVLDCRRAPEKADQMFRWSREETSKHRQVYRSWGTIGSALHLAWYVGCETVRLVGCDGHPSTDSRDPNVAYDRRLRQFHDKVPGAAYVKLRQEADRIIAGLGLTSHYVGTPKGNPAVVNNEVTV